MAVKILVASPISSFGDLIRTTLTSHGDFSVVVCETGDQALGALAGDVFDVLILDAALSDQPFAPLIKKITASLPDQKIAIIPPENKPDHPLLENVTAHGFLFRPFLDPDLINLVQRLASAAEDDRRQHSEGLRGHPAGQQNASSWMEDPARANAELSRLLLGSSALAGLVIHNGELWVHSGRISNEASQEINQMLFQVKSDREKDLVRFTFLVADDCEALVYAVQLISGWTLALVYDVSMPLTRVRSQATSFAAHMRDSMRLESLIEDTQAVQTTPPEATLPADEAPQSEAIDPAQVLPAEPEAAEATEDEEADDLDIITLDDELIALINEVSQPDASGKGEDGSESKKTGDFDEVYSETRKAEDVLASESPGAEFAAEPAEEDQPIAELKTDEQDTAGAEEELPLEPKEEERPSSESTEEDQPAAGPIPAQTPAEVAPEDEPAAIDAGQMESVQENEGETEENVQNIQAEIPSAAVEAEPAEEPAPTIDYPAVGPALEATDLSSEADAWEAELQALEAPAASEEAPSIDVSAVGPAVEEAPSIDVSTVGPAVEEADLSFEADAWEAELRALEGQEIKTNPGPLNPVFEHAEPVHSPASTQAPPEKLPLIFQRMDESPSGSQVFSLVFAPRRADQFLAGELGSFMGELLKSAAPTFPWKLTGVSIRPQYMQLSIEISQYLEPEDIIHFIKEFSANAISQKFPALIASGDGAAFWADEHLVISDHENPDGMQLRQFLQSIRDKAASPA